MEVRRSSIVASGKRAGCWIVSCKSKPGGIGQWTKWTRIFGTQAGDTAFHTQKKNMHNLLQNFQKQLFFVPKSKFLFLKFGLGTQFLRAVFGKLLNQPRGNFLISPWTSRIGIEVHHRRKIRIDVSLNFIVEQIWFVRQLEGRTKMYNNSSFQYH